MTTRSRPAAVLAVVAFGVFVAADDLTVVTTMLRSMIVDFGITLPDGVDDAAWIVNTYLIGYVAVMPFAGRLSDLVGRRKVYLGSLVLFAIGSLIIVFTDSYGVLLFGRVVTAVGGGALVPVGLAIVSDVYPRQRRATALGVVGAVDTIGWVWGPLFGAFLIRFFDWRWQFRLNVPLALLGLAAAWVVLREQDVARRGRLDWAGALALTVGLVALNIALLESSDIQSVSGLEELTGAARLNTVPYWVVTALALGWFWWHERRARDPIIDLGLLRKPNFSPAIGANFLVGAALIIAMVDVPLFINVIERGAVDSAVISGRVLSALTVAMAVFSYLGGRLTARWGYRGVTVFGLGAATTAYLFMSSGWDVNVSQQTMALQLMILGAGFGLVTAPTQAAAVNAAPSDRRGVAAGLVIVFRLMGLSVGLAGLTAWGLHRFNELRDRIDLPALGDPGYEEALAAAQAELTSTAIAETFLAAAVVALVAIVVALLLRPETAGSVSRPQPTRADAGR